jgi:gamma-glutamyltranspeptidase/glutathione hydrolase
MKLVTALCVLWVGVLVGCARPDVQPVKYGAVATIHPLATDAAMDTLRAGGNAVDAAMSAMLTLGVVDGHNSGIGGGCFILIRTADGRTTAIDARETAPAKAHRDMYLRDGKADTRLSQTGPLAVATPGALAGYDFAVRTYGNKSLAELLLPAAELAERGFAIDRNFAAKAKRETENIRKFEATAALLVRDGKPLAEGDWLVQRDLAATYRAIAADGTDYFYRGPFATAVGRYMAENGGVLSADDFANYRITVREPLVSSYRGFTVVGMPPPSSGGLHVGQILKMLERFDLRGMSAADRTTTVANAMKLAFADRAWWLGDPAFANVPTGLLDAEYLAARSAMISSTRAIEVPGQGTPPAGEKFDGDGVEKHTTHVSVADAQGNVVSVTSTINTSFGSKVIVPGTGVLLNNQMDDFAIAPGTPNAFGLVGNEANAVAPLKRPLSSMSPTIVLKDGRPVYVIGAAGGPKIITQVVCVLIQLIDLGEDGFAAMNAARYHHQWRPDKLWIEKPNGAAASALYRELEARGFELDVQSRAGATNLVVIDGRRMRAVSEPRGQGTGRAE